MKKSKRKERYKSYDKKSLVVYLSLRFLVIICMIMQILRGEYNNALLCLLSLVLFLLPSIVERKLDIDLPNTLEIIIYLFIFSAEILGEINNFYHIFPYWDTMLHVINGFLCAAIGFSIVDFLNKTDERINLSPLYLCVVAFCFSMTIGVLWEFFEYSVDKILLADMQKDTMITQIATVTIDPKEDNNSILIKGIDKTVLYDKSGKVLATFDGGYLDIGLNDTMKDLIVNFIGAFVFCIFGYFYNKNEKSKVFVNNFMPKKKTNK